VVSAVDEEANEVDGEVDEAFNGITDDLAGAVVVTVLVAVGIDGTGQRRDKAEAAIHMSR
jgi:hypothetical protein